MDRVRRDAECREAALDALRPPAVEVAAVLGEAQGVAGVVEGVVGMELGDRLVDRRGLDALGREVAADLVDGAVAAVEVPQCEVERVLEARRRVDGARGQAEIDQCVRRPLRPRPTGR